MATRRSRLKNIVGNVISAPSRLKSKFKRTIADRRVKILKKARSFDKAPDFRNGKPTKALKFRSAAEDIRRKVLKKNKKK